MEQPPRRGTTPPDDKRPCWECLRRRVVCDCTRPTCTKCLKAGIVCPGYGNAKPLKWLTPGSVTFRRRKDVPTRSYPSRSPSSAGLSPRSTKSGSPSDVGSPPRGVPGGSGQQGSLSLSPPRVDLKCDTTDIIHAVTYYNEQIYPSFEAVSLCKSPYVSPVSIEFVRRSPNFLLHISVSLSIRHRIYRLSSTPDRRALVDLRLRYHQQRSLAIEALNENIAKAEKENPYLLIVGVSMFVFAELQHSLAPAWKFHMDAVLGIITRRGGLTGICREAPWMKIPFISFVMAYVTGCTTSPPSTLKLRSSQVKDVMEFIRKEWDKIPYPNFLCPLDLLLAITQVNYRRSHKARSPTAALDGPAPEEILEQMTDFAPEDWAPTKTAELHDEWLLLGRIYQSASILFCLCSLSDQFTWFSEQDLNNLHAVHKTRLMFYLRKAEASLPVIRACVWPIVVSSVAVALDDLSAREFVRGVLDRLAEELATTSLTETKAVFEEFWWSGKRAWDECFERPYAFVQ